ncbi:MAG: GNAT family N-acetyltransferase [Caldicoprobacterales bacterium]
MEIKFVPEEYKESIKHVLNYCFSGVSGIGESFVNETYTYENCLGCFDEDKLVGLLYIYPYDMHFYGNTVPMGGIGVVSTLPEYRYYRCASNMLIKSVEIMKDRGYAFSALAPFSYAFYRKYGWELGFNSKRNIIPVNSFKDLGTGKGQFRPLTLEDIDSINQVYRNFYVKYNGSIDRDKDNWKSRLKRIGENRNYGYSFSRQENGLNGYIFFSIESGVFYIHEMVYDSIETKLELFRFIYNHNAQVREVNWKAPLDDNTMLLLDNPRIEQKIEPGMMIRVVDVARVLRSYKYPALYKGGFTINITDKWAPWNNGTFKLIIDQGTAEVNKIEDDTADISCDINVFSQVALGYTGIEEAIEIGKITVHNLKAAEDMKTIFKEHVTYMTDGF